MTDIYQQNLFKANLNRNEYFLGRELNFPVGTVICSVELTQPLVSRYVTDLLENWPLSIGCTTTNPGIFQCERVHALATKMCGDRFYRMFQQHPKRVCHIL